MGLSVTPTSPVVIGFVIGFTMGQQQSREPIIDFLFSKGVQCHLERQPCYRQYGMSPVSHYTYRHTHLSSHTCVHTTAQIGNLHAFCAVRYNVKRVLNLFKQDLSSFY